MAKITLDIANTGEQVLVELDLDSVTNTELIYGAISEGIIPSEYKYNSHILKVPEELMPILISKNNMRITETATLATLGFVDGDTIKVFTKPSGL
jgi:hypothetical protein